MLMRLPTPALLAVLSAAAAVALAAAPPAQAAEQLLGTMTAQGDGTRVQSTATLEQGRTYRLVVSDSVTLTYPALGGRVEAVDALYCYFHSGADLPGESCQETPPGPGSVGPLRFDIDGGDVGTLVNLAGRPVSYEGDHSYDYAFVAPSSGPLGAKVRAFTGATASGFLSLELYGEPAAPAGPAPVPAVPPGTPPGQPAIVGPPLFRIVGIDFGAREGALFHSRANGGATLKPRVGWVLGAGDAISVTAGKAIDLPGVKLQAVSGGATFTVRGGVVHRGDGAPVATPGYFEVEDVPRLREGEVEMTTAGARAQQAGATPATASLLTPLARVDVEDGTARVAHSAARTRTRVGDVRGRVSVTPSAPGLAGLRLVPGQEVEVTGRGLGRPAALVPDLETTIPSPRVVRAGPTTATAPATLSLRSLKRSKCVAVLVGSTRPARVLVTIFSGRRSVRLFGQRLVVFRAAGRTRTCILVPKRARTFDVRTPLRFAVGYALGARRTPGQRATSPVIRPIRLVP